MPTTATRPKPAEDTGRVSPEEYLRREKESEHKNEYHNGEIISMAGASREHVEITDNLTVVFRPALRETDCKSYSSDMRVWIEEHATYAYPDIAIVCGEADFVRREGLDVLLNPTLIVEVLSDSTEAYDRGEKFATYRTLESFREYVLITQDKRHVEVFSQNESGEWMLRDTDGETVELASVEAELDVAAIYEGIEFEAAATGPKTADGGPQ